MGSKPGALLSLNDFETFLAGNINQYSIQIITKLRVKQYILTIIYCQIMMKQDKIRKQNKQLRETIEGYLEEIDRLKQTNQQHEAQIETLLKFNERLLTIIETQLNSYNARKSERSLSLQPISQITQKDSEVVQGLGTIKASIVNNLKFNELDIQQQPEKGKKSPSGNQTDRVMLGRHLEDALSYEISRSDYQKQYSEYSQKQKVKEVMALINQYKQEYGQSIQECQYIKAKIKEDMVKNNQEVQVINQQNEQFYDCKISDLNNLKQTMKDTCPQKQLQKIIKSNKYSVSTQNRLMKIMNTVG